jgi:hypothetical protein
VGHAVDGLQWQGENSMSQRTVNVDRIQRQGERAVREASPWIELLGRFGYAAKGVVYVIVGLLAAQAALGIGGDTTDTQGALQWIVDKPFGKVLLGVIAVGLLGYAIWRFVQAAMDTENKGTDAQGIYVRAAYAVLGLIYLGLSFSALQLALGSGGGNGGGDRSAQDWTAWLMSQPFGPWLVAIAGAGIFGSGLFQLYRAYTANFREKLKLAEMSPTEETWATRLGRLGFTARGIAFGVIGALLVVAAIQADPGQARGLGGALQTLADQPFGPWVLGLVALGLMAYGLYMGVEAKFRRMVIH